MNKRMFQIVALVALMLSAPAAFADMSAVIMDTDGDPAGVSVTAGSSFDVIIRLSTDISLTAIQLRVKETTDTPSGFFRLDTLTFSTPPNGVWSGNPSDHLPLALPVNLDASGNYKTGFIGNLVADLDNDGILDLDEATGPGTFDLATLQFTFTGPPPPQKVTYQLNVNDILYGDTNFDETPGMPGLAYSVTVVPAPGAALLGMIGLGMVGRLRKRLAAGGRRQARAD